MTDCGERYAERPEDEEDPECDLFSAERGRTGALALRVYDDRPVVDKVGLVCVVVTGTLLTRISTREK